MEKHKGIVDKRSIASLVWKGFMDEKTTEHFKNAISMPGWVGVGVALLDVAAGARSVGTRRAAIGCGSDCRASEDDRV